MNLGFVLLLFFSTKAFSVDYMLNGGVYIDVGTPKKVEHLPPSVIFTYDDMAFLHEILDADTRYNDVDLTGHLECFIRNMFDDFCNKPLREALKKLSDEEAKKPGEGLADGKLLKRKLGEIDIFTVYHEKLNYGHAYILANGAIHHITVTRATEKRFNQFFDGIREKSL